MKCSITILCNTYNESHNIDSFIQNALKLNCKILFVDSNSTDNTVEIINSYNSPLIKVIILDSKPMFVEQIRYKSISYVDTDSVFVLDCDEYIEFNDHFDMSFFDQLITYKKYDLIKIRLTHKFFGKKIRHGGWFNYTNRLFNVSTYLKHHSGEIKLHKQFNFLSDHSISYKNYDGFEIIHKSYTCFSDYNNKTLINYAKIEAQNNEYNIIYLILLPFILFVYKYIILLGFLDGFQGLRINFYFSLYRLKILYYVVNSYILRISKYRNV